MIACPDVERCQEMVNEERADRPCREAYRMGEGQDEDPSEREGRTVKGPQGKSETIL